MSAAVRMRDSRGRFVKLDSLKEEQIMDSQPVAITSAQEFSTLIAQVKAQGQASLAKQIAGEQVAIDRTLKYLAMLRKNWVSARQRGDAKGMYRCERAARRKKDVCNWYFGAEIIK